MKAVSSESRTPLLLKILLFSRMLQLEKIARLGLWGALMSFKNSLSEVVHTFAVLVRSWVLS